VTIVSETTHAPSCSISSGEECTCGRGCGDSSPDLPDMLHDAAAVGCTISPEDAPAQLFRADTLRSHVTALEHRPGLVAISFDADADTDEIDRFIDVEKGCCEFLHIERANTAEGTQVVFSSDDPGREPTLELIAGMFDPATQDRPSASPAVPPRRESKALFGVLGVACLACCIPPLLAAGALGALAGGAAGAIARLGGTTGVSTLVGVLLALGALATLRLRRSNDQGCGC
jgi:hypothetical protein